MSNEIEIELSDDIQTQEPKKYKVLLLNDDYSTMDFVIDVLIKVFRKNPNEAQAIMLSVHQNGKALCGIYTYEIASTKVAQVKNLARQKGYPLKAIMEEE